MKNYEKIHNESLEKIKDYLASLEKVNDGIWSFRDIQKRLLEIFPELAESEDEKIKKEIIEYVKTGTYHKNWVSWLERQGEQKPVDKAEPKFKVGDKITEKDFDECGCGIITDIKEGKYIFDNGGFIYIEEQGLWKLVEQNPADKVEPKFKVGDWVVYNNNHDSVYQIEKIENFHYTIRHILGGSMPLSFSHEDMIRPWTIQDAKDGDVLAAHECYVIFKEIDGLNIRCHCTYHYMGFNPSIDVDTLQNKTAFHPATKKQRDTLEKAMVDAGYSFDFEKKELKKIEQKIEWSEEDEIGLSDALWCCKQAASIAKDENDMGNCWYAENWLKSLKEKYICNRNKE